MRKNTFVIDPFFVPDVICWIFSSGSDLRYIVYRPCISGRIFNCIDSGRDRVNLPNAPIAHEGFFATHFFTVHFSSDNMATPT